MFSSICFFTRGKIILSIGWLQALFLFDMQSHMAIEIFKRTKSCGVLPNDATYNIMIDCCSILRCFRSACALVSMMIRDGFYPKALTFSSLMKVSLHSAGKLLCSFVCDTNIYL